TNLGGTSNFVRGFWESGMPSPSAFTQAGAAGPALAAAQYITTGGITVINTPSNLQSLSAPIAITNVTDANPAVVSTGTTTGLVAGQSIVRLYGVTGMQQISSVDFTVGTISAGVSFQLKFLDSSAFAAVGTAGNYVILPLVGSVTAPFDYYYYPKRRFITNVEVTGAVTRLTLSVTHGFTVGQLVKIIMPTIFGAPQLNNIYATIVAIGNADASSITNTIDINTNVALSPAFAWPTSAQAAAGISFPIVVPVGEAATNTSTQPYANLLDDATRNLTYTGVQLGTSVQGASGHTMQWIAEYGNTI
ncbi:MAG: hypothetical protein WAN50_02760, partial [Minisyncoccia bacterium]